MRKAKVDENLIAELEAGGEALSGQINEGRATPREREVRAAMRAADRLGRDVVVPTVVLPSCTAVLGTASSSTRACLRSLACGPVTAPHRIRTKLTQIMSGSWSGARSGGCKTRTGGGFRTVLGVTTDAELGFRRPRRSHTTVSDVDHHQFMDGLLH